MSVNPPKPNMKDLPVGTKLSEPSFRRNDQIGRSQLYLSGIQLNSLKIEKTYVQTPSTNSSTSLRALQKIKYYIMYQKNILWYPPSILLNIFFTNKFNKSPEHWNELLSHPPPAAHRRPPKNQKRKRRLAMLFQTSPENIERVFFFWFRVLFLL